jgi:hypothetical protein
VILLIFGFSTCTWAQTPQPMPPGPPPNPVRPVLTPVNQADEDFSFLANPAYRTDPWDPLKYQPLNRNGDYYLTYWLENRSEYEWFQNEMWGKGPQTISGYWLQRVIPAVGVTLGSHFRIYSAFQYAKEMGNNAGPRPGIDEDQGDFPKFQGRDPQHL